MVVCDQHPAHHCVKHGVRQLLTSRYRAYFLPASSSWFNSAEWIFAVLKPRWRKRLLGIQEEITQQQMEALVTEEIRIFCRLYRKSRLFHANRRELQMALRNEQ